MPSFGQQLHIKRISTIRRPTLLAVCFTVVVSLAGAYFASLSNATSFSVASETEIGTRTGPASIVADASASNGAAVRFGTIVTPPETGAKPNASNTGVPAGTSLQTVSGNYSINTSGAVVSGLDISGSVEINASNVTFKNSRIRCTGESGTCLVLGSNSTIDHVEIGGGANGVANTGTGIAVYLGSGLITHSNIHNTNDGFRFEQGGTASYNYIHDLDSSNGAHSDGSQTTGWGNISFIGNYFQKCGNNSCIFLKQESGNPAISNVTVDGNWLECADTNVGYQTSYELYPTNGTTGLKVTNNHFTDTNGCNPGAAFAGLSSATYSLWSNNTNDTTGAIMPKP